LNFYNKSIKASARLKIWLKVVFFIVVMGALGYVTYYFGKTLEFSFDIIESNKSVKDYKVIMKDILGIITVIVPAIASLIVAFLNIPEIIAQYLFNVEEDYQINAIIKNIQDYDIRMFELENRAEKELMKSKSLSDDKEQTDEEFSELPQDDVDVNANIS